MIYDLTTRKNLRKACEEFGLGLLYSNPIFAIGKYALDKFVGERASPEEQRETAIQLIREAKKQGAKNIEFEMDSRASAELGTNIDGAPIKVGGSIGNKTKVRVEFK